LKRRQGANIAAPSKRLRLIDSDDEDTEEISEEEFDEAVEELQGRYCVHC